MCFRRISPGKLTFKHHHPPSILEDTKNVIGRSPETETLGIIAFWGAPHDLLQVPLKDVLWKIIGSDIGI